MERDEVHAFTEGFIAYIRDEDLLYLHNGSAWVTFENALDAI